MRILHELSWLWETLCIAHVAAAVCMACAALIGNEHLAPSCKGAKLMDSKAFKDNVGYQELAAWVEELGLYSNNRVQSLFALQKPSARAPGPF